MLTLIGISKLKRKLIALGNKQDSSVNAILQKAVDDLNTLKRSRFPQNPPTP